MIDFAKLKKTRDGVNTIYTTLIKDEEVQYWYLKLIISSKKIKIKKREMKEDLVDIFESSGSEDIDVLGCKKSTKKANEKNLNNRHAGHH